MIIDNIEESFSFSVPVNPRIVESIQKGEWIAVAYDDGKILVFSQKTGHLTYTWNHIGVVKMVSVDHLDTLFYSLSKNGSVYRYSTQLDPFELIKAWVCTDTCKDFDVCGSKLVISTGIFDIAVFNIETGNLVAKRILIHQKMSCSPHHIFLLVNSQLVKVYDTYLNECSETYFEGPITHILTDTYHRYPLLIQFPQTIFRYTFDQNYNLETVFLQTKILEDGIIDMMGKILMIGCVDGIYLYNFRLFPYFAYTPLGKIPFCEYNVIGGLTKTNAMTLQPQTGLLTLWKETNLENDDFRYYSLESLYRPVIVRDEDTPEKECQFYISNKSHLPDTKVECLNISVLTLEPYRDKDNPIKIHFFDTFKTKFDTALCTTRKELKQMLKCDVPTDEYTVPIHLMCIYTRPWDNNTTGHGGKPTNRFLVKLPFHNIYVTIGSLLRAIQNTRNKDWFAYPLYGGKRRRVGNTHGVFGTSMNHGQIPGYVVYTLCTEQEVVNEKRILSTVLDWMFAYSILDDDNVFKCTLEAFKMLLDG